LVFKEFLQPDIRNLALTLEDSEDFRRVIGLDQTPHFTTFEKAAKRLLRFPFARRCYQLPSGWRSAVACPFAYNLPLGFDNRLDWNGLFCR